MGFYDEIEKASSQVKPVSVAHPIRWYAFRIRKANTGGGSGNVRSKAAPGTGRAKYNAGGNFRVTKISTRSLQALEDERFDLLPGGIFNKGFVTA